jgi:hypothetical protein
MPDVVRSVRGLGLRQGRALRPGSYLYFDRFHHRCDELRAFAEFMNETAFVFELAALSRDYSNVAFRLAF